MLKILFPFMILTSFTAQSKDSGHYQLFCMGNRGAVQVLLERNAKNTRLTYTNIGGKSDFPIYEGVVTPKTLYFIKYAESDLGIIDTKLIIEWKNEQCTRLSENSMIIACNGEADIVYPINSKLKSYDFFTSMINEQLQMATYQIFKFNIGIDSENFHYLSSMPFDPKECQMK